MAIFLIRVTQENGKIYLRSVNMQISDDDLNYPNPYNRNIFQLITDRFDYSDRQGLLKEIEPTILPKFCYGVKYSKYHMMPEVKPVSYTLPANVTQALDLLSAYHSMLKNKQTQFIDFDFIKKFSGKRNLKRETLLNLSKSKALNADSAIGMMIDRILSLPKPPPEYHQLICVLRKMADHVKTKGDSFGRLLKGLPRASIMLDLESKDFALREGESTDAALRRMYGLVRQLIGNHLGAEATRFLDALQRQAIQKAYFQYTNGEHDLIYKTILKEKFTLLADGRIAVNYMSSRHINKHIRYGSKYDKESLRTRAYAFAKRAGLEFERTADLEQLVFTKESSQKLIEQQLHINSDYVKKIVRLKNEFHRFYKANKENDGNFKHVAVDVIKIIMKYAYPEIAATMNVDLILRQAFEESAIQPFKAPDARVTEEGRGCFVM